MNTSELGPETTDLTVHECWKHLRSASVGRLAVISDARPEIFPVNYLPDEGTVIFRTGPGTKLNAVLSGEPVVLEADGLNTYGTIAWSVVVKGIAAPVQAGEDAPAEIPSPWEEGAKDVLVRITPSELSGRRFVIGPPTKWWPPLEPATGQQE
ncbi:pyridoxamine 5'-phosphate oxidase family protein [Arthrobacter sp. 24S4-2]|uniref:pyridoxamine 5'-phosphate oxidase family protein n=1 Tax=Arthrobacter sp. 24S4-2 TaxID=2575374 RepID=UPI0010C781F1|nr:pyridoxamine 5'-phosphate oxidase family protein [Arthrobacter sp. 24S4-2]QCP00413.1 pyridoxamine 5'-phosphate oxidase family protein [Arthrobacter sp. 24S4-2]